MSLFSRNIGIYTIINISFPPSAFYVKQHKCKCIILCFVLSLCTFFLLLQVVRVKYCFIGQKQ